MSTGWSINGSSAAVVPSSPWPAGAPVANLHGAMSSSPAAPAAKEVLFLLKGYPRLSETFIAQEIRALEQRGLSIRIVALRRPTDRKTHPVVSEIRAPVGYL